MKKFKKALALMLAALLCIPTTLATVYAAEVNGTYDAEDAKIEGKYETLDWTTWQPVAVDPVESNANASGGKNVGFFSTIGNSITWTVNATEAGAADLTFVLASCYNEYAPDYSSASNKDLPLEGHFEITVNGNALDLTGKVLPGDKNATQARYDYYQGVTFNGVALNAGANTITIKVTGIGSNQMVQECANVDCLKVSNYTAGAAGNAGGNAGAVSTVIFEAEKADLVVDLSAMSWMGVTSAVEEKASASGGQSIGYFGAVGNKITWTVDSANGGAAELAFVLASGAMDWTTYQNCDMKLDGMVKITVNGTELPYSNVTLPAGNYENWQDVKFDATLKAGANTIVLEVIDATYSVNVDCLKVTASGLGGGTTGGGSSAGSNNLRIDKNRPRLNEFSTCGARDFLALRNNCVNSLSYVINY